MKFRQIGCGFKKSSGRQNEATISENGEYLSLTERFTLFDPEFHPFLNDTFGTAMNQNVTFSGTPEIIHNGGTSTEWTGSAIQGSWDFSTGGVVTLTSGVNNDEATFAEETPTTIDMSGFTAITGVINLTTYSEVNNDLTVEFDNAGVAVGNSVNLNNFMDTTLLGTAQNFVIPKGDMGLASQAVDGFTITLSRSGGPQVSLTLDDIQIEQTGTPAIFKATTPIGTTFHVTEIRIAVADNVTGVVTNGTMQGLAFDALLGVSTLSNGLNFRRVQDGEGIFNVTIKQLGDFLATGSNIINAVSDGTNTFITLLVEFPEPIILSGSPDSNFLSFTVNDDLSGLLQFTAAARGALVMPR